MWHVKGNHAAGLLLSIRPTVWAAGLFRFTLIHPSIMIINSCRSTSKKPLVRCEPPYSHHLKRFLSETKNLKNDSYTKFHYLSFSKKAREILFMVEM
ncbi:hypothetical protein L5515_018541 [Caenorhabditis briggsae]|uniref:Uncharacterized protein n=1 Tax=Caenorhabditis briggsae TaxID=6238 RepID=A0AAE9FHD7_CAEBR|nr:hypothetical protein L5515_018541 [Caenorhabditis briggsae]